MKRRKSLLLFLAAGVVLSGIIATQEGAETRRFWRDRTPSDRLVGEYWPRYRRAMLSRSRQSYYRPTSTRIQRSRLATQASRSQVNYATTRTNTGVLSEQNVYNFRRQFADGQSRQAMRSALGEPAEHTWNKDIWKIQRIGLDGKPSGEFGTFEASYDWGNGGWDGSTTNPPKANW